MKKSSLSLMAVAAVAVSLVAYKIDGSGGVKGTVVPAEAATQAMAVAGTDTIKVAITAGVFEFKDLKAGGYKIIIDAVEPLKDVQFDVAVQENKIIDVGSINIQ
ncbi:hypothetical protein [Solitalea koreensis]|uniref:Carboxypeptidase regulatory-like domain-containing protein n=1 Tax=Solitalea koreensis TaxID=543615 RepID=A0A521C813_9SPHI|nr:hypothetical protein [Solitalea koreensis]SMO55569.1 hypothetical protein SAMN06265350_103290 [Solitalea koreensis]